MKRFYTALSSIVLAAVLIAPQMSDAAAQQNKMKACNVDADAKGLSGEGKGDERKTFMKACLSAKPAKAAPGTSQQNKMTTCSKDAKAKNLAGDERKTFMKSCLSS
ncbi:MAG: phosphate starvation-inducible protein PsiF [Nitrospira sp.]|nr:phosphate starvation-inducible protein PsiF [Nitrospira sp.]